VQFRLKSDHAKNFWPFIDSQPNFTFIDEERLAQLAGRELWTAHETSATRAQFRKECREAFRDMQMAGGLKSWREEVTGSGRTKSRRYHYIHALPRQMELALIASQTEQPTDKSKETSHQTDSEFTSFMLKARTKNDRDRTPSAWNRSIEVLNTQKSRLEAGFERGTRACGLFIPSPQKSERLAPNAETLALKTRNPRPKSAQQSNDLKKEFGLYRLVYRFK
jgi:hypothetical protein